MPKRKVNWGLIMGIPGSIGALIALWILLGFPTLATSGDIQKLNARQTDHAIDFYSKAVRDETILRSQITEPVTQALIDQRLREAQDKLKQSYDRKIGLAR